MVTLLLFSYEGNVGNPASDLARQRLALSANIDKSPFPERAETASVRVLPFFTIVHTRGNKTAGCEPRRIVSCGPSNGAPCAPS